MVKNVLEYLEAAEGRVPDRPAYRDGESSYTFFETGRSARAVGTRLLRSGLEKRPVAVLMEKSASMAVAFLGIVYSGCFYCPLDVKMPKERLKTICGVLEPAAVITEPDFKELSDGLGLSCPVFLFDDLLREPENQALLFGVRSRAVDTDPLYILFTSGSTGVPKGVVMSHRVIINNMEWLEREFDFSEQDVMGNQVPFHFDVANHDLYCPLKFGCCTVLIPPDLFSAPARLVSYLNENRVTGIFWVPFALCVVSELDALKLEIPRVLRYIFFAGEVMPVKQLNYWRRYLPDAEYVNMYGSTETHVCTYYRLDREFGDDESLPIGRPCGNIDILVLDEDNRPVEPESGEVGELCIRGGAFALGYYGNPALTLERFVQNPLNTKYQELIYRTGDMVSFRKDGALSYHSRRDFQVKRLGYRIELGEIEAAAGWLEGIERCACLYDSKKKTILLLYSGEKLERKTIAGGLSERLPKYMMPGRYIHLEEMPLNGNGKIDRRRLKELYV